MASGIRFPVVNDRGEFREVGQVESKAYLRGGSPENRRQNYQSKVTAWREKESTLSTILNDIGAARLELASRTESGCPLRDSLRRNRVTAEELDALIEGMKPGQEVARQYLGFKAEKWEKTALGYGDVVVPVMSMESRFTIDEALDLIRTSFSEFSASMAEFVDLAVERRWLECSIEPGRISGGFCSTSLKTSESRIYMPFDGSWNGVISLAHELGHGFHHWTMRSLHPWQRDSPAVLRETISTLAERLVERVSLTTESLSELRNTVIEGRLLRAVTFFLDLPMRYNFERRFYAERRHGPVSPERLNEICVDVQQSAFGNILNPTGMNPMLWAMRPHLFLSSISYYNWPYTFAYLLSLKLTNTLIASPPESVSEQLHEIACSTGTIGPSEFATRFIDADLSSQLFWRHSSSSLQQEYDDLLVSAVHEA